MEKWEQGALNEVSIEGILSENKLKESTDKDGNPAIIGEYRIKTQNVIDGVTYPVEIPISVYQSKITKNKKENPAYVSMQKLLADGVSLAAGGEEKASGIRLTERSTSLQENIFMPKNGGQLVYTTKVRSSFASLVGKSELKLGAKFKCIVVVGDLIDEVDSEGVETGRLILKGILPQYGGKVDVVNFIAQNVKVVDHIKSRWQKGDTVLVGGYINFTTSETQVSAISGDTFGEPISSSKTKSIRELVITGGGENPLTPEEGAYDQALIAEALQDRQGRIEKEKEKGAAAAKPATPNFGF
jgi:hypothetical protein